jgi:hypothetical protein
MKKTLIFGLFVATLVALAQSAPKAVLLRIDSGDEVQVVGALEGSKWAAADSLASGSIAKIKSGLKTVMFTLKGTVGRAMAGGKLDVGACDWNRTTGISTPVKLEFPTYAIDAAWNPVPRASKTLPSANATYTALVAAELKKYKAAKPARVTQIVQADLDGDKQLEVLIVAQSLDNAYAMNNTGDYSLVLVRKIVAGKVQTFKLIEHYIEKGYDPATDTGAQQGSTNGISAIADIDGNGSMEVFVDGVVYEGYGVSIYSWNGKGFTRLIDWGCGV